ncbi:MAG: class I SAM-dependent methyltransferase [Dehalococcoidia bacterium]
MAAAYAPPSALQRWSTLVRARREQMEAQLSASGGPPADWWAGRSAMFARGIGDPAAAPPFGLRQIADRLSRSATLIDIGAGAGRYSVPLSRLLAHVTLVEPSPAMAEHARAAFAAAGRDNFTIVEREWPGPRVPRASAVLMANVLAPVEHLERFLRPALRRASEWLFIIHGSIGDDSAVADRIAEAFHGEPRIPNPGAAELIPALHELGIYPDIVMGTRRFARSFDDLDHAATAMAGSALVAPTRGNLTRLRRILRGALRPVPGGRLALPVQELPIALMTWRLDQRTSGQGS